MTPILGNHRRDPAKLCTIATGNARKKYPIAIASRRSIVGRDALNGVLQRHHLHTIAEKESKARSLSLSPNAKRDWSGKHPCLPHCGFCSVKL
ncbi:MAG TPA: hypothetical protein PLP21_03535 [Pyrinomonadaceae bacterium]|nr:hypothetical protein [Pyrinomonadaceae bacterium]